MKNIFTYLTLAMLLCSCSQGVKFDIDGRLADNAASVVYLVVENSSLDTLASASVNSDNTFHLKGSVKEPTTAFICDDNGNALTILLIEESESVDIGELGIFILDGNGYFKKYGGNRLISLNEEYGDILLKDYAEAVCCGRVVGKLKRR